MKAAATLLLSLLGLCGASEITREFTLRRSPSAAPLPPCWDSRIDPASGNILVTGFEEDRQRLVELGFEVLSETKGYPLSSAPPAGYHTPTELFEEFQEIAATFPGIAQLIDLTTEYGAPTTHEGRRLYTLKLSDNVKLDEDEPNVLVVSNHHSRELITPELALNTTLHLVQNYGTDAEVTKLLNEHQLYVMWTMNPDGLAYVWSADNMWRKNRRPGNGVDLNRNYPIGWDFSCAGSTLPSSETYRGPAPASEPETQTMMLFQKERRFSKVLDFHSYAREVRIIYGDCASLPPTMDNYFKEIGVAMAEEMDYEQVRSCCMGGNVHFAFHDQASMTFLVETGTAFQPSASAMREELARVLPGTMNFLNLPITFAGKVLDRASKKPLEAKIVVEGIKYELEEQNYSNPKNGLFHVWLPQGTWNVTFSAQGYPAATHTWKTTSQGSTFEVLLG